LITVFRLIRTTHQGHHINRKARHLKEVIVTDLLAMDHQTGNAELGWNL
jgi:hypothetical protein